MTDPSYPPPYSQGPAQPGPGELAAAQQPYGAGAPQGYAQPGGFGTHGGAPAPRGNAMAVTGFVIALVGFLLCLIPVVNFFAIVLCVVGFALAIVGLVKAGKGAPRKGLAIAGIVLAVLGSVGGAVSAIVYGVMADAAVQSLDEASDDLDKMTGDATEQVLADEVSVEIGDFAVDEDEYGLVTTALPVTLTNTSEETQSFDVTIEAVDESGNRITNDVAYVSELRAGQSDEVDLFQFVEENDLDAMKDATFEVVEASVY